MTRRGLGFLVALVAAVYPVPVALAGTYYAGDLFVRPHNARIHSQDSR